MNEKNGDPDGILSCLSLVLFAIFALPVFGIYLMSQDKHETKMFGGILTAIGFAIWIILAVCFE